MAKRRIIKAKVSFISLVHRGANLVEAVFKSADGDRVRFETAIVKSDVRGEFLSLLYIPDRVDAHGEWMSREDLAATAYETLRDGASIDLFHDGKPLSKSQAYLASSWIADGGDRRFLGQKDRRGQPINPDGAWAVLLKVDDPALQQDILDGKLNAVSMGGAGVFEVEKSQQEPSIMDETLKTLLQGLLMKALNLPSNSPPPTPPTPPASVPPQNSGLEHQLLSMLLAKALAPERAAPEPALPPTGPPNPLDPNAVLAHYRKIEAAQLAKAIDWNDPTSVLQHYQRLSAVMPQQPAYVPAPASYPSPLQPSNQPAMMNGMPIQKSDLQVEQEIGSMLARMANEERFPGKK